MKMPINLHRWVDENRDLLKPPVGNKKIYEDQDFMIFVVGGPNARKDYRGPRSTSRGVARCAAPRVGAGLSARERRRGLRETGAASLEACARRGGCFARFGASSLPESVGKGVEETLFARAFLGAQERCSRMIR